MLGIAFRDVLPKHHEVGLLAGRDASQAVVAQELVRLVDRGRLDHLLYGDALFGSVQGVRLTGVLAQHALLHPGQGVGRVLNGVVASRGHHHSRIEERLHRQKVIAQSGSTTLAFPVGCEAAQGKTKALLDYTGCKTMDDIMALSEEELQKAYVEAVGQFTSCPYYGTEVLPEAPIELYKKGYAKHISIMAGSTADEARIFMGEGPMLTFEEQKTFASRAVGDAAACLKEEDKRHYEEFQRVCRFQEPGLVETELIDELMFRVPMLQQLDHGVKFLGVEGISPSDLEDGL